MVVAEGAGQLTISKTASERVLAGIALKRSGERLPPELLRRTIADFVGGRIPDYQMAAWLATVACQGMDLAETIELTRAYVDSGTTLNLRESGGPIVDKHSTGGVGDKTSLIVVPLVASCGVAVAKMSGRGLGFAGGTLDKLESIKGLRLDLNAAEVKSVLSKANMVITGQHAELVPGDEATYALRDVTGTVDSIPLIAASVMCKKIAMGSDGVVLDIKAGGGALIPGYEGATQLAEVMTGIGRSFGLPTRAVLSDMNQPLGYAVGNAVELREAIAVLRGKEIPGLTELCRVLARLMLQVADHGLSDTAADTRIRAALESGAAFEQLRRWVAAQGGDARQIDHPELLPAARRTQVVTSQDSGWIQALDARLVGAAAARIGAGRFAKGQQLDHAVGIILRRKAGDHVSRGEALAEVHLNTADDDVARRIRDAFTIGPQPPAATPVIHRTF
jgi:pyrimidine-nucleoside phosphorylase